MILNIFRGFFWALLFPLSVVLLGLTGYRIHYTKGLNGGDNLTSQSHFYDPIIVELLVTSILALLFCFWFIPAIFSKMKNPLSRYFFEHIALWIIWIMFLVGAAIMTHKWLHLKQCRKHYKTCRILETIKAFSWMCFIVSSFLIILSLASMFANHAGMNSPLSGEDDYGTYPETRQTRTTNTTTTAYPNPNHPAVVEPAAAVGTGTGTGTTTTTTTAGTTVHGTTAGTGTTNVHTHPV